MFVSFSLATFDFFSEGVSYYRRWPLWAFLFSGFWTQELFADFQELFAEFQELFEKKMHLIEGSY